MALLDRPLFKRALDKILENRPLVGAIVDGLRSAAARKDTKIEGDDVPVVQREVVEALAASPVVANALNAEPPRQSRVVSGSSWALVGGLGMMFTQLGPMLEALETGLNTGSKWAAVFGFLFGGGAFGGGVFALFGRLKDGLPPMTRRWWNPFSWFAPATS